MKSMFLACLVCAALGVGGLAGSMLAASNASKSAAPTSVDPALARTLTNLEKLASDLDATKQRLANLETRATLAERVDLVKPAASAPDDATAAKPVDPAAAKAAELATAAKELAPKFAKLALDGVPPADLGKLMEEVAKNGQYDAAIAALKSLIDKNPNDSKTHYLLGQSYYAKLSTSGSISAYQTLGPLTLGEWEKASELDPKYWEPKFNHATYLTFVPEALGMTPQVISEFESLVDMQNGSTSNPQFAQSYAQLGRMYLRVGKKDKALRTLRDGAALFPDDAQLKKQLDLLEKN